MSFGPYGLDGDCASYGGVDRGLGYKKPLPRWERFMNEYKHAAHTPAGLKAAEAAGNADDIAFAKAEAVRHAQAQADEVAWEQWKAQHRAESTASLRREVPALLAEIGDWLEEGQPEHGYRLPTTEEIQGMTCCQMSAGIAPNSWNPNRYSQPRWFYGRIEDSEIRQIVNQLCIELNEKVWKLCRQHRNHGGSTTR